MRGIGSSELRVTSHPQGSPKTGHPELIEQGLGDQTKTDLHFSSASYAQTIAVCSSI